MRSRLPRILSAYTDDSPFSVDLVGAVREHLSKYGPLCIDTTICKVLRQSSFVRQMNDLGWCEQGFLDSEPGKIALQHSVARYHA